MRAIFERGWVFVAHESQVSEPGDYKAISIGTQPVVVSRHKAGAIYVLLNRCRHRGSTVVCRSETGHSNYFRCPYHNSGYANDAALAGMAMSHGWPEDFDKSAWGLRRVRRSGPNRRLFFASLAEDGPSLEEHLAPMKKYIFAWFDRSPAGSITVLRPHTSTRTRQLEVAGRKRSRRLPRKLRPRILAAGPGAGERTWWWTWPRVSHPPWGRDRDGGQARPSRARFVETRAGGERVST